MIPKEEIDNIIKKVDLRPIVFQYSDLKPSGANLNGKCPFCSSLAFSLSTSKRIFKCFRCQKGGNIINFIKEIEKLTFYEAIDFIQTKFKVTIGNLAKTETRLRGTVYALELENNCYYIGFTQNFDTRMKAHFSGEGALWTKKHKPVAVLDAFENRTLEYENVLTEKYIEKYGYHNVRGGDHFYFHSKYNARNKFI